MPSLSRDLRKNLENTVKAARTTAEAGARKALDLLAVGHHEPWPSLTPDQRKLRNRLRAHARQLGDPRDTQKGTQGTARLVSEVAYEQWHRLLFARFLAETDLLIEPASGMALSLDECQELAREQGRDWLPVACEFAERMLPQIFRRGDPVLEIALPPETRSELEDLLKSLSREVFLADDSLGWVYQFWQANRKEEVNLAGNKIGADELPAVTQLFTEDYMVEFLLHNTLGAWWAGRCATISDSKFQIENCPDEAAARAACALPGIEWKYLRFVSSDSSSDSVPSVVKKVWTPAAGTFDGWPRTAAALRMLDPCMGSGHFLVFALPILVAFRMAEENLTRAQAVHAVLRDNLHGLELDPRCTQIAAFNLALAAWKLAGHQPLPSLHLACSGLSVGAEKEAWLKLADRAAQASPLAPDQQLIGGESNLADNLRQRLRWGMGQLYDLFKQAPLLGSLLNPRKLRGEGMMFTWDELRPLVEEALAAESTDEEASELAVTAKGLAKAAEILAGKFTLVATNVPYLGRGKQDEILAGYCEVNHREAKVDLATCFMDRSISFSCEDGSFAVVTPQSWLSQDKYDKCRKIYLTDTQWQMAAQLGTGAFRSITGEVVKPLLFIATNTVPKQENFIGLDVISSKEPDEKATDLSRIACLFISQHIQLSNPRNRISFGAGGDQQRLLDYADYSNGIQTGDSPRFSRSFWEITESQSGWEKKQTTINETRLYGGMTEVLWWQNGQGDLTAFVREKLESDNTGAWLRGKNVWGKRGVLISAMGKLHASLYLGDLFDDNTVAIVAADEAQLAAIWTACSDASFHDEVRKIDKKLNVRGPLVEIPFDLAHWQKVAAEKYPNGLPAPHSDDPTQWLFTGHPKGADQALHVAFARLLGYRWPRQTHSSFPNCPALGPDGLEAHADADGIVPLSTLRGEASAAERLNALLAAAYGLEWSAAKLRELLAAAGSDAEKLDDWLRDEAFAQHCALFHQRPFVWHIWDGLKGGFSAFVNYHHLAGPDGLGRRTLEKLIFSYLGDWIDAQRAAQKAGVEGSDARLAAAEHLRRELEAILAGEPPYDLFIRWKPLGQQPLGWEPDINDGVRLNLRPWMAARPLNARGASACILRATPKVKWDKDRGKEPERPKADYPWFWGWENATEAQQAGKEPFEGGSTFDGNRWNEVHLSLAQKRTARL